MLSKEEIEEILLWWKLDGTIFTTDVEKIEKYIYQAENQLKAERQNYMQMIHELRGKNIELDRKIDKLNKIIDEMSTMLEELKICHFKREDGGELLGKYRCYNKEDWKQYFEKKVEGK